MRTTFAPLPRLRTCRVTIRLVIDVYDMAKPVQAFGVYSSFRSPINEFVQIGCQGFKTGEGYIFHKGSMFVNISADYADEDVMFKSAEAAARAVAGNITDSPVGLDMMSLLPSDGKMPNSEKYFLHAVLGQSFLDNGVTAQYPYEGGVARLFVCDLGSEDAAAKAYSEYLKFADAHGEPTELAPKTAFYAQVKYYGLIEVHLKEPTLQAASAFRWTRTNSSNRSSVSCRVPPSVD